MKRCRYLTFQARYIPLILEGRKTQTRRLSGEPGPSLGDIVPLRMPWKKRTHGLIEITNIRMQRLEDITQEEAEKEGFRTLQEFKKAWGRIYGSMNGREIIMVYEFRLISPKDYHKIRSEPFFHIDPSSQEQRSL